MMVHGDDHGLCMPPAVAPIQVVVIPIPFKEEEAPVQQIAESVVNELNSIGVRAHLDVRDIRPGKKFYDWERHGVPLRLEVGPEDVKKGQVVAIRRDTGEKQVIQRQAIRTKVKQLLDGISGDLRARAWKLFKEMIHEASDVKSIKQIIGKKGGMVLVPWCEQEACGQMLEEQAGVEILGQEFDGKQASSICPICSKRAKSYVLMAKTY
jgi:prolyl-tRNA synthetase